MKAVLSNPIVSVVSRLVLAYVFIIYAFDKIIAPKDFAHSIMNYEMVPHSLINIFALTLPWIEMSCGIMLLLGVRLKANALIVALMNLMFVVAISVALARGLEINCGCSAHSEPIGMWKILEDLGYLVLAMLIYFFPNPTLSLESYLMKQMSLDSLHPENTGVL